MINQLNVCQLEHNKVFHIHMELLDKNTDIFDEQSQNPSPWEIYNSEKWSTLRETDICLDNVNTFIKTMLYSYDNMEDLHWVHTNKMEFKKWKRGAMKNSVKNMTDRWNE